MACSGAGRIAGSALGMATIQRIYIAGSEVCLDTGTYGDDVVIGHVFPSDVAGLWTITDRAGKCHGDRYTSQWRAALQLQLATGIGVIRD